MKICTFFGSRNVADNIKPNLRKIIVDLIENKGVRIFYVGNQGNFDYLVLNLLRELKKVYTNINVLVILAYMPSDKKEGDFDGIETIYPYDLFNTPMKYRIYERNCWMLNKSEYVVTCVRNTFGGASKFKALAEKKAKTVIEVKGDSSAGHEYG